MEQTPFGHLRAARVLSVAGVKFLFHLWNHNPIGIRSLEDVIGIMGHQLRALGHEAVWYPSNIIRPDKTYDLKFTTNGINVLVEGFLSEEYVNIVADQHAKGARFICIATEEPTQNGFNYGRLPEMVIRQRMFLTVAKYFEGVLHLVPGKQITDWYSLWAPSVQAELGFAGSLVRSQPPREPYYDFGFFGSLSKRRETLIKRLAKKTGTRVRVVSDLPSQNERDAVVQECKVVVQIRRSDEMGFVSSSRCNTSLHCGRPVIAEPHDKDMSKPWDEVIQFADDEEGFYSQAHNTCLTWKSSWSSQFARFKDKLTPEFCIGQPLRELGIIT